MLKQIKCEICGVEFSYESKRGRPPVRCEECKLLKKRDLKKRGQNLKSEFTAVDFKIGEKVFVLPRDWHGIWLEGFNAKVVELTKDSVGDIIIVSESDGGRRYFRPNMLRKR